MKVFVLLVLILIKNIHAEDEGILCDAQTCSDYISASPCTSLSDNCKIQNSTHNGLILPSPDPCNCCTYCLDNLKENDYCAVGDVGSQIPDAICGPGLFCLEGICVKMTTIANPPPCSKAQADYDQRREDGTVGSLEQRPECDDDGYFATYKCISGQTCFCVDKSENRIFGEIPFSSTAHLTLKCGCSRKYYEVLKFFDRDSLYPNQHFRCTDVGDYDTIQCIGDECMCTDSLDGAPTYPTQATVNISEISSTTLPDCFDKNIHETGKYYHACAESYIEVLDRIQNYKTEGYEKVFAIEFPDCSLDGRFAPVQKDVDAAGTEYFYCAHPDRTPIEHPSGGFYQGSDASTMDCKCARSNLLIPESAFERPECCLDGGFNKVQCRRGMCYCVDSDGYQDVANSDPAKQIEVEISSIDQLFCYDPDYETQCLGAGL